MESIAGTLRAGVKKIISEFSPPGTAAGTEEFRNSSHQEREILFVLGGRSRYMLNGSCYEADPGTAFLIGKWVPHAFGYRRDDCGICHLWVHLSGGRIFCSIFTIDDRGGMTIDRPAGRLSGEVVQHLRSRWDLLDKEENITPEKTAEYLKAPVDMLLDEFLFRLEHRPKEPDRMIVSAVESLREHIIMSKGRNCSLKELEQLAGFSRYYLAHQFLRHTGMTIGNCIDEVRAEYTASAMLRGLKQKEIAFELGFNSPANFWAWLQKHKSAVEAKKKQQ